MSTVCGRPHGGGAGSGPCGRMWTGGGGQHVIFCRRHKWMAPKWKEFGLSPWPFNPSRFKFRPNNGSINKGVGLQGGAKMSDYLVKFQINYLVVALNNTSKSLPIANLFKKTISPPRFWKNFINVSSTGQMQCFLFVNAETFSPLQHGQLQLFYCCKFTSRIDSQSLTDTCWVKKFVVFLAVCE